MRDKTREAMRLFLGGRCYTAEKLEKDYLAEVANYSNDRWEAPQRASRLAASVKRYKTSEMLRFICKRTARAVLTGMCYSAGSAMRHGSSSLTRLTGQSAMTPSTWRR